MIASLKILFITILLFLFTDFFFGKKIVKKLDERSIFLSFETALKKNIENEKKFRVKNKYFSHSLKENYKGVSFFGSQKGFFCTNKYGFKSSCKKNNNTKKFDYIFLGDSFAEGVGLSYEKTFVGIFENSTNLNVANLAVQGYSPIIHYHKLNFFLNKGLKTDHVILYVDVSDVADEISRYECNGVVCNKKADRSTFRANNPILKYKNIIKNNFEISLALIQQSKKFFCQNYLLNLCSYIYSRDYFSSWINDFDNKIGSNGIYEKSFEQQIFYIDKIYSLLSNSNIKFSIAIYPWPGHILYDNNIEAYQEYWKNYCKNKCNLFINHFEDFQNLTNISEKNDVIKKLYFYGDMHFNSKGNQVIANKLINTISSE